MLNCRLEFSERPKIRLLNKLAFPCLSDGEMASLGRLFDRKISEGTELKGCGATHSHEDNVTSYFISNGNFRMHVLASLDGIYFKWCDGGGILRRIWLSIWLAGSPSVKKREKGKLASVKWLGQASPPSLFTLNLFSSVISLDCGLRIQFPTYYKSVSPFHGFLVVDWVADITRLHRDRQTRIKSCFDLAVDLFYLASSRPFKMELSDKKFKNKLDESQASS